MAKPRRRPTNSTPPPLASSFAGDQLYQDLLQFTREAAPHQRITSGRILSKQYGVSHSTVNAVITRLADEGCVYTVHGKGSFVAERSITSASASPSKAGHGGETLIFTYISAVMEQTYGSRMMQGVVDAAREHELHLQVWDHAKGQGSRSPHASLCAAAEAGASAFILPWIDAQSLQRLREINPAARILVTAGVAQGQPVASVLLDFDDMGQQAGDYLLKENVKRPVAIYRNPRFGEAVASAYRRRRKARPLLIEHRTPDQTLDAARMILDTQADGLAFSDDRGALSLLRLLVNHDPAYLSKVTIISHANAGEALLPVPVALLESDGYDIGHTAVATLEAMRSGQSFASAEVRLKSNLIKPAAVSLTPRNKHLTSAS